jgi:hypothetical protein
MASKAALLALLTLWGVGVSVPFPAWADDNTPSDSQSDDDSPGAGDTLTDKVWVRAGSQQLPGVIKIFLSDGTLVQDSCWEPHRFSAWHKTSASSVVWNEDGMDIAADIVTLTANELVLSLKLTGGDVEERYEPAQVPYVCPDMPKG